MHKFIFTVIFVSFWFSAFAQVQITGIGPFRLNYTTTAFMDSLATSQKVEIQTITNISQQKSLARNKVVIARVLPDTINLQTAIPQAVYCKDAQVFYIPAIGFSDGNITEVYLTFYKKVLVSIQTDFSEEIYAALTEKYGNPKKDIITVEKTCGTGKNAETFTETTFSAMWLTANVACSTGYRETKNNKCEEVVASLTYFSVVKSVEKMEKCHQLRVQQLKN